MISPTGILGATDRARGVVEVWETDFMATGPDSPARRVRPHAQHVGTWPIPEGVGVLDVLADHGFRPAELTERFGGSPYVDTEQGMQVVLARIGTRVGGVEPEPPEDMTRVAAEAIAELMVADAEARGVALDSLADLALSASVNDTTDLAGLPVFIVATDLVRMLADFAEVTHTCGTLDRAELETSARSLAAARGYVPPAVAFGTVSA